MRISSSNFNRFWYRHPIANPVLIVVLSVYVLFVILFTAVHGAGSLQSALALPVSAVLFAIMICLFPIWAGHHDFNWVLAIMLVMFLAYNIVCARRRCPAKIWLFGLISVPVVNCVLNLLFAKFGG
jgi:hypothetical protein